MQTDWPYGIGLDKRQARRLRRRLHLQERDRRRDNARDAARRRDIRQTRGDS